MAADVKVTKEQTLKAVEVAIKVLKTVGDPTVVAQAEKIETGVQSLVDTNKDFAEKYATELKSFDQNAVQKYGPKVARVVEFVAILAVAAKVFLLG